MKIKIKKVYEAPRLVQQTIETENFIATSTPTTNDNNTEGWNEGGEIGGGGTGDWGGDFNFDGF